MSKKNTVKKTAALLLGLALTVGSVGCANFITTNGEKDLAQTVATVNISKELKKSGSGFENVADDVADIISGISNKISKRDLVAYFLSVGYQYVESYGYSYKDTFNMLMEGLVQRKIVIQYAIAYYLQNEAALSAEGRDAFVTNELNAAKARSEKEYQMLKDHEEVLTLKYFLTENGANMDEYDYAVYSLKQSLNSSLDSLEGAYIKTTDEEHDHAEARTLPDSLTTETEKYFTKNYEVYTGRNTVADCGAYEKVEGSTRSTRQSAYNAFLANLQSYGMVNSGKKEDTSKIENLDYYYVELTSILGQSLINKYYEDLEVAVEKDLALKDDANQNYVERKYASLYKTQEESYSISHSSFETAIDGLSDTSFVVYGRKNFGFVYNILLPFSADLEVEYNEIKNNAANSENDIFNSRKKLLSKVKGKDLRDTWISEHDHANYSYKVGDKYYFFPEHFDVNDKEYGKYEGLKHYAGNYPFNGEWVDEDNDKEIDDGEMIAAPVSINGFIKLMNDQMNAALGSNLYKTYSAETDVKVLDGYANDDYDTNYKNADGDIDYSKFVYYSEKTPLTENGTKDFFVEDTQIYKAASAVNELMFAYSTDPGCLNTYLGYAVSPYGTDFVKEFEYAAQKAVEGGAGSYYVCATDYGWHIVYATFVFEKDGEAYAGGYIDAEKDIEGSFSNLFYESIKSSAIQNYSTQIQNDVLNEYNNDDSVTLYKSRYKDLLNLD